MDKIGIVKEFDNLGRIVIPKEMRQLFEFEKEVELVITVNVALIHRPEYKLAKLKNAEYRTKYHTK